jgi:hypothetical protein
MLSSQDSAVKRLLNSRTDGPLLAQTLDIVARLQASPNTYRGSSFTTTSTTTATTKASGDSYTFDPLLHQPRALGDISSVALAGLSLIETFVDETSPLVSGLEKVVAAVDLLSKAAADAQDHIVASNRAADEFVAAAADLRGSALALRGELQKAKELSAEFEIRPQVADALLSGPISSLQTGTNDKPGTGSLFFFASLDELLRLREELEKRTREGDSGKIENEGPAATVMLEQLEACDKLEAAALDLLFDWTLEACKTTDDATFDASGVTPTRVPVVVDLRKAVSIFAARRPLFLSSMQQAFVHARRGAFLRRFLSRIMAIADTGSSITDDAPVQMLSEIFAIVHGSLAEESAFLSTVFSPALSSNYSSSSSYSSSSNSSSSVSSVSLPDEASAPLSLAKLLSDIANGISTPMAIRVSAVLDDAQTIAEAVKCLDTILFYKDKLSQLVGGDTSTSPTPTTSILSTLSQAVIRAQSRAEQILVSFTEQTRSYPISIPTRLTAAPLTSDTCSELQSLLQAASGQVLSDSLSSHLDIPRYVQTIVEPVLAYCRASSEGMGLINTSIWMINNAASIQASLTQYPYTSETVQMLAGEVAAWEDQCVAQISNDILRSTGAILVLSQQRDALAAASATQDEAIDPSKSINAQQRANEALNALTALMRLSSQPNMFSSLDAISYPKVRARTKRDVGSLVCSAYSRVRAALVDASPSGLASQPGVTVALEGLPKDLDGFLTS